MIQTYFLIHCSRLCMTSHDTELTNDVMFIHSTARVADPCSGSHMLKPGERRIIASLLYLCKHLWNWGRPFVMVTDQSDCHTPPFPLRPVLMFRAVPHFSNNEIQTLRKTQSSNVNNGRNLCEPRLSELQAVPVSECTCRRDIVPRCSATLEA